VHSQLQAVQVFQKLMFGFAYDGKRRIYPMQAKKWILAAAVAAAFFYGPNVLAQQPSSEIHPATTESQETNIRAYVELLRVDVRTKKTAIFTEIMQFNDEQAAKFWPIYSEYDIELQKLNDQKLAGIQEYAKNFGKMTDEKANELAMLALELENKRNDLKKTYYEKVRQQLGGIIAARFLQIENQLLMVIDLQIAASLPIVE
jgi:DNA anti-recombination protein RmuC